MFEKLVKELNHHAYCFETCEENTAAELCRFLEEKFGIKSRGNPDFFILEKDSVGIEESRILKERNALSALSGRKIFLLSFGNATREAQNALLKLLEDPPSETFFFIIVPDSSVLLPTLLSRTLFFKLADGKDAALTGFLKKNITDRLKFAEKISSDFKNSAIGKSAVKKLLNRIEREFHEAMLRNGNKNLKEFEKAGREILKARSFIDIPSASVKMIFENLALALPLSGK